MTPHRGTLVLILGIVSFVCCLGPIVGIPAWIMGNKDLKEMQEGRMDPSGQSLTNIGRILGMIGSILWAVVVVIYIIVIILSVVISASK